MIKKIFFIFITVSFSFALPLILFEIYLIYDQKYPPYEQFEYKIENIKYKFNDNPKKYSSDISSEKVIFLGDSFVYGNVCAGNKKDFVNRVKSKIKNKKNYQIFNFGSYARGPSDYLLIFNHFKENNLKKLIVVLNYNDIAINVVDCKTIKVLNKLGLIENIKLCDKILNTNVDRYSGTFLKSLDNFLENTYVWRFIREKLYVFPFLRKYYGRNTFENLYQNKNTIYYKTYIELLTVIKKEAENNRTEIEFVYFPEVNYLKKDNPKYWKLFINEAKKNNIEVKDSWEYFLENKKSNDMRWSLTDYHPNCKAHKIMSEYILKYVL